MDFTFGRRRKETAEHKITPDAPAVQPESFEEAMAERDALKVMLAKSERKLIEVAGLLRRCSDHALRASDVTLYAECRDALRDLNG